MKVWKKIKIKERNKDINIISNSLTRYIEKDSPFNDICSKYNISINDRKEIENHIANRVGGLLLLYFSKDTKRINDIINKYTSNNNYIVTPELEGYVEK